MAKPRKHASKPTKPAKPEPPASTAPLANHSPARHPILLAVAIILFLLWFAFLLLTALT